MHARRKLAILALAAVLVLACGCACLYYCFGSFEIDIADLPTEKSPGGLVGVQRVGVYPALLFRLLVNRAELPAPPDTPFGALLYRVRYWTDPGDGTLTLASGLLALPASPGVRGVVSYQHGTTSNRHETPSRPTLGEGVLGAALFAGNGYVFCAPDYIGLGASQEVHPYLHARATANSVIDFLKAARLFTVRERGGWPSNVCLAGFSQGGHATAVVHRQLEKLDDPQFHVVAAAPVAGPCDLAGISFPYALQGRSEASSLYLAYLTNSYAHMCKMPLDSLLTAHYAASIPVLFDGEHEAESIDAALPSNPRELFRPDFLECYERGESNWFIEAMKANTSLGWVPRAPVRVYHGDKDLDVSPEDSKFFAKTLSAAGADVQFISVGPYAHDASAIPAFVLVRQWFDEVCPPVLDQRAARTSGAALG